MRHKRSVCGVDLTSLLTIALMGCGKSDADKSATGNAAVDKTRSRPGYACHVLREDTKKSVSIVPAGSKWVFTLTGKGS